VVLLAICGRIGVPGGNCFPSRLFELGTHSDPDDPATWRTMATGIPAIQGMFPPNVMPEEILSDHPDRLRAVFVLGANPLRSYADTTAYEKAFKKLDLLVTTEIVMTETAALSHYVLPARSAYESWDSTSFAKQYPKVFFQMRRPIIEPEGEPKESSEIFLMLAEAMGLVYDGSTYGVNINRLTASRHWDRIAATPLHRYVPCRVEAA
jgi:anaerobic selenocysteine-containing dehydrogenase